MTDDQRGASADTTQAAPRPASNLRVAVVGLRKSDGLLVWVKASNVGGAPIVIDTLSSYVKGRYNGETLAVSFGSGPELPLRLEPHSWVEWKSTIKQDSYPWMARHGVTCTAYVSGEGMHAYRESLCG
jgi:hypothetical protein